MVVCLAGLVGVAVQSTANIDKLDATLNLVLPECAYHHGYHYQEKEATIDQAGHKEFWTCCNCQHQYLTRPDGEFVDQDDAYMIGEINEEHIAYIAPLTEGGKNGDYWTIDPFDDEFSPQPTTRIIVMAGQSNAAGVGHFDCLENSVDTSKISEIESGYDNVLITGFSHGFIDEGPVYANATTSTMGAAGTFGFEIGLADRLSKVFPDETTYIVKYAFGATSLNYDWISPSSNVPISCTYDANYERGWLYNGLVTCLTNLIDKINTTTNTLPSIEAFMWMQGESDACFNESTATYLSTFNNLVNDFKNTFRNNLSSKFAVYDASISPTGGWMNAEEINEIKRSRADEHNIYIDTTSSLTTTYEPIGETADFAHYDAACYIDLGHIFADTYLANTIRGYSPNTLEIEAPASISMKRNQNYNMSAPTVLFNGASVNAKITYYAEQSKSGNNIISYFTVNGSTFTPTRTGSTNLRITAYYNDEVKTVVVPVTITY